MGRVPMGRLGKKSRGLVVLPLLAVLLGEVEQAQADTIINTATFSATPVQILPVTPFDPTLGRLDKVTVFIQGLVSFTGIALPNPAPYSYQFKVFQNFTGLGGRYFAFETPAEFFFNGEATGAGDFVSLISQFSYSFTFDEASDLMGDFVIPKTSGVSVPPIAIRGTRNRFMKNLFSPIDAIQLIHGEIPLSAPIVAPTSFGSMGSMMIEYDFTPASPGAPGPPKAQVTVSGSGFHAGQTVTVGVEAEDPAGNPAVDLYVGALLPDGQTVVFLSGSGGLAGPSSLASPAEFTRLQAMPQGSVLHAPSLFQFTFPSMGIPPGIYQVFAGLARQGAFADDRIDPGDILALNLKVLVFLP